MGKIIIIKNIISILSYIAIIYFVIKFVMIFKDLKTNKISVKVNIDNTKENKDLMTTNGLLKVENRKYKFEAEHYKQENKYLRRQEDLIAKWEIKNIKSKLNDLEIESIYNGKKAIVANSNLEDLMATRMMLICLGFTVDIVETAEELISRIGDYEKYDLAIVDSSFKNGKLNANDVFKTIRIDMDVEGLILLLTGNKEIIHNNNYKFDDLKENFTQAELINILTKLIK